MKRNIIDPGLLRMIACVPFIFLGIVLIAFQIGKGDSKTLEPTQIPSVEVKGNVCGGGLETDGHREAILRRAAEGWRYAGFVPRR